MRLIDADKISLTDFEIASCIGDYKTLCKKLIDKIDSALTIDAVPVVRCRDCKWWGLSPHNTLGIHVCKKYRGVRCEIDYCSRAERSEDGET